MSAIFESATTRAHSQLHPSKPSRPPIDIVTRPHEQILDSIYSIAGRPSNLLSSITYRATISISDFLTEHRSSTVHGKADQLNSASLNTTCGFRFSYLDGTQIGSC
ncbi:hypothetical protein BM1_02452 [Bipolaris maydis]|nr:hypothetical protein BM1_02452 [Bipolaris maydis]